MMINLDIKIAIAQFGMAENLELKKIAKKTRNLNIDWYLFDEMSTMDKEFELSELQEHYDVVILCIDAKKYKEIKQQ